MGIWQLPVLLARILNVALPDVAAPDRQAVILLEGEIHRETVVGRGQIRGLELGPELEQEQERGQAWVALTRITLNNVFPPADRQEELCRPA